MQTIDQQLPYRNTLVAYLKDLQSKQSLCSDTEVPIEVLRYTVGDLYGTAACKRLLVLCQQLTYTYRALDLGGNPDISTLDLFKQGLQDNQATKGKVQALQQLRSASKSTRGVACLFAWDV